MYMQRLISLIILDAKIRQKFELTKRKGTFLFLRHKSLPRLIVIEDAYLGYSTLRFVNIFYRRLSNIFSGCLAASLHLRLIEQGRGGRSTMCTVSSFRTRHKRRIAQFISSAKVPC